MLRERVQLFLVTHRKIIMMIVCVAVLLIIFTIYKLYEATIQGWLKDPTSVGVAGTLLGAIVGGVFSLLATVWVNNRQQKARSQIRRMNVIYKPLYDELMENHQLIKEYPYPYMIMFQKSGRKHAYWPEYTAWERIKIDSRYLEVPAKLKSSMELLHKQIKHYMELHQPACIAARDVLNQILNKNLGVTCSITNIGDILVKSILDNKEFDLFEELSGSFVSEDKKSINKESFEKAEIQKMCISECRNTNEITMFGKSFECWKKTEEKTIKILALMIKRINTQYEG